MYSWNDRMNLTTIHIYCLMAVFFNLLVLGYPQIKNVPKLDFFPTSFDILCYPCNLLPYSRGYEYPKLRTAALRDHRQIRQMRLQIDETNTHLRKIVVVCFLVAFLLFQLDSFKMLCNQNNKSHKNRYNSKKKDFCLYTSCGIFNETGKQKIILHIHKYTI
jgi:hypothetical protein